MSSELIVRYYVSKLYCVFSFNLRPLLEWDFLLFQIVFNYKRLGLGITAFKIFLFLSRYLGLDLKSSIVIPEWRKDYKHICLRSRPVTPNVVRQLVS